MNTYQKNTIVKFSSKYCMLCIVWIHCYLLTNSSHYIILSRILHYSNQWAHCVMHQLDWPFVVLANRRSMLSATNQLRLSFVVLLNEVHDDMKLSRFTL